MDIVFPDLRDRRIAAFDQSLTTQEKKSGDGYMSIYRSTANYRANFNAWRRRAERGDNSFHLARPQRRSDQIRAIVLHITCGNQFVDGRAGRRLDNPQNDRTLTHDSRLDQIAAHFVVTNNATVYYTHDVQLIINSAAQRNGIDIEFAGNPRTMELTDQTIRKAREFITALVRQIPTIEYIFPHGQITRVRNAPKFHTCPGPDVWVNVGQWCVNNLGLSTEASEIYRVDHGISPVQMGRMTPQEYRRWQRNMRRHRNRQRQRQRRVGRIISAATRRR